MHFDPLWLSGIHDSCCGVLAIPVRSRRSPLERRPRRENLRLLSRSASPSSFCAGIVLSSGLRSQRAGPTVPQSVLFFSRARGSVKFCNLCLFSQQFGFSQKFAVARPLKTRHVPGNRSLTLAFEPPSAGLPTGLAQVTAPGVFFRRLVGCSCNYHCDETPMADLSLVVTFRSSSPAVRSHWACILSPWEAGSVSDRSAPRRPVGISGPLKSYIQPPWTSPELDLSADSLLQIFKLHALAALPKHFFQPLACVDLSLGVDPFELLSFIMTYDVHCLIVLHIAGFFSKEECSFRITLTNHPYSQPFPSLLHPPISAAPPFTFATINFQYYSANP